MTPAGAADRIIAVFGLGVPELIVILVIALLVLGPGKLPDVGKFLGRSLRDFRDALENREGGDGDGDGSPGHRPGETGTGAGEPPQDH